MARLLENEEIGSFQLGEKIGEGGMAIIYKATQPSLKRDVVVKKLKDPNREIIARFKREALVSASFSQENVLAIYDFIYTGRFYYLVMEHVDGDDLRNIIDFVAPLPVYTAALIMREVARGLEYTHSKNIIHRDIKPSNILISKHGDVKLIDFGVARDEAPSKLTVTGMIVGTPSYMSPEQANGDRLGKQTDIYSLGVLLYEMLTRVKPFSGETNTEVLMKIVKGKYESPTKYNRDLPYGIVRIIKKAMRKDTRRRYQNASEMIRDLDKFIPWRVQERKKELISRFLENYRNRSVTKTTSTLTYSSLYQGKSARFWLIAGAMIALGTVAMLQMQRFLTAERYSRIELNSNISLGSIFLNQHPAGRLTTDKHVIKNLSPGIYNMEIHGEGSNGIFQTSVELLPAEKITVFAEVPPRKMEVNLIASTSPSGAKVFLDDQLLGETPLSDLKTTSGTHQIKLVKDGYKTLQTQVKFQINQSYHLNYTLHPESRSAN